MSTLQTLLSRLSGKRPAPLPGQLYVKAFRSLAELCPLAARLDALNLASRRPTPFDTFAYMQAFVEHDQYAVPGQKALVLVAFDGPSPLGFLPLRRVPERLFGIPYTSIQCLMTHDNERPRVVSRPADEARCSEAFYRFLLEEERGWDFLQIQEQDAFSAMRLPPASVDLRRFRLRHFPNNPNATLFLPHTSLADYLHTFQRSHRHRLEQMMRKLEKAGEVELVTARDPSSLPALFDLYLELEKRSWKAGVDGHIGRHPQRVAFFRRLLEPDQPMKMEIRLLLLDGSPIAGTVTGTFQGVIYGLEEAFDDAYRDLAPGNAMMVLLISDAIANHLTGIDMMGNYAYYKAQWGATITDTAAVQLHRKGSLVHLRALAGELWRWLRPPVTQADVSFNLARKEPTEKSPDKDAPDAGAGDKGESEKEGSRKGAAAEAAPRERPARDAEREQAQAALRSLAEAGAKVERLSGEALFRPLRRSEPQKAPPGRPARGRDRSEAA